MEEPQQQPNYDAPEDPRVPNDATRPGSADSPRDVVALVGYLDEGGTDDFCRLRQDGTAPNSPWLAVNNEDIIRRFSEADDDRLRAGQSVIWVSARASLAFCRPVSASLFETLIRAAFPITSESYRWPRG